MSLFTKVINKVPRRNAFNLSNENHLTANFGQLIPVMVKEVIPGDKFKVHTESVVKLAPMQAPAMSRIDVYFHYFFVPNRLVYSNWENFITGGERGQFMPDNPMSPTLTDQPVAPFFDIVKAAAGGYCVPCSLADYMGIPTLEAPVSVTDLPPINALPFLAYHKIYSDWFRDEMLNVNEFQSYGDGEISQEFYPALFEIHNRAWKKDYFTSARPDTQLGSPVQIPLSGNITASSPFRFASPLYNGAQPISNVQNASETEDVVVLGEDMKATELFFKQSQIAPTSTSKIFYADGLSLDEASIDVNSLRRALRLQAWEEKNMRGGNRYIENIFNHFGVKSSDARLQRSQFLGGRKIPVVVGEVLQSVDTQYNDSYGQSVMPLGTRGGVASASGRSQDIKFFAEEHGFLLCIMSIMPHASYMQGIPRFLGDRWNRFSYAWPEFGNLGEQEVFNWELYLSKLQNSNNDGTFGYQSRYAEMKFGLNEVHGEFKTSLKFWHTAREFGSRPNLNLNFVNMNGYDSDTADGINRIFAVNSNQLASHFYCHLYNDVKVLRLLPKYGIPSI